MLFSGLPFSDVLTTVRPDESSVTLTLIVHEIALVHLAVFPFEFAFAVHFVLAPVSCVGLAVWPVVVAEAADFVVLELAFVVAAVSKGQSALTLLLAVFVLALVSCTIRP